MKASKLLLSGLDITEDEYSFKAQFFLSSSDKRINVDICDLDSEISLEKIKALFDLEESLEELKNSIMSMIIEKANIGSKINEGESYNEAIVDSDIDSTARSADIA